MIHSEASATTASTARAVTFLFTDIEGSTRLWQDHPEAMNAALARHDGLLREIIEGHDGHVFRTAGDAFYAIFDSSRSAVGAAMAAQVALGAEPWPAPVVLRVRMALHHGEVLSRGDHFDGMAVERAEHLLSAAHGGQVLATDAFKSVVEDGLPTGVTLWPLGDHRLKDLDRPAAVFQVVAAGLPVEFPPLRTLSRQAHNLPIQLTRFIGRRHELAELGERLRDTRLLTITGVGGTGKTRLALQLAAAELGHFPDGVWLVELAALIEPGNLAATVAAALGLAEEPGRPIDETLVDYLKPRQMLLILDNCEHLLAPSASLASRWLGAAPGLSLLVTSREALGIAGERIWPLASLSLPAVAADSTVIDVAEAARSEAVQLFVERARAAQPQFELNAARARAVIQICRRLDGIPLALELAAARVRMLPVEQVASRLDDRFRLLTGGSRTALPRHQTLLAALDWSHELLDEAEQAVFRRLAVFRGGWTMEAAEAVASGGPVDELDVLDLLSHLVDKSLVTADQSDAGCRYRYLESVGQYARDKLIRAGESEQVRAAHLAYFCNLATSVEPGLTGPEQEQLMALLEAEHDNLRAAIDQAMASGAYRDSLAICVALWRFWFVHGHWSEGRTRLAGVLEAPQVEGNERLYASAFNGAGGLANSQSDYDAARTYYEASLALRRAQNDRSGIAASLGNLGVVALDQGDVEKARSLQEESLSLRREIGDRWQLAVALCNLGAVYSQMGDNSRARALYEEALSLHRLTGDKLSVAMLLSNLGILAADEGDHDAARALHQESLTLTTELGDREGIAAALTGLGWAAHGVGDDRAAIRHHVQSLVISRAIGNKRRQTETIEVLGWLAAWTGDSLRAARLMAAAEAQWQAMAIAQFGEIRLGHSRSAHLAAEQDLGTETFALAWSAGAALPLDAAVTLALGMSDESSAADA